MAGIDSLVNSRADMFAANPQGLQQRYAMNQDLLDLLALQKLKKDKEAAQRSLQMQMQPESGTVKDQLEGQMMQATKQEVAASLAPGLQQQGQMMQAQQMQQAMGGGVASQPAPNMVGMARGGIVGYAPGGDVQAKEVPYSMNALRAFDERRRLEQELRAAGLAEEEARALAQDPASAQNVLRSTMNVRNMPSEAPKGIESVLSEGTTARDIPVSMDALSRQDARRAAERAAEMEQRRSVLTGDPIADNIIQSRRAAETMTPEQAEYLGRRREEPSQPSRFIEALGGAPSAGGGTGRVTYMGTEPSIRGFLSDPQSYRDMRENVAGVPVVGEALDKWLAKAGIGSSTTQDVEADPASAVADALIVYAGSGLLKAGGAGAGALFRMMANNPRITAALTALGIKGGDELIDFARQNVPGVVSDEGGNAEAGIASLPATATTPSGAGTAPTTRPAVSRTGIASPSPRGAPSAEEAAMDAYDTRARTTQREAPQDPRMSRYEAQLARLEAEETDKLGALIAFLQGAGASGGTNLGATLMGGGSGIQVRDARIRDEMTQTLKNIETLQLQRDELAQQESQFGRGLESEERRDRLLREVQSANNLQDFQAAMARAAQDQREAAEKSNLTPAQIIALRDKFDAEIAPNIRAQLVEQLEEKGSGGFFGRDEEQQRVFDEALAAALDAERQNYVAEQASAVRSLYQANQFPGYSARPKATP